MKYNRGLIKIAVLIILMPLVLNKLVFSKTADLFKDYRQIQLLEKQLIEVNPDSLAPIHLKLNIENYISNGRIVEFIALACEENCVLVKHYEPLLLDQEGIYKLYTANLTLSGNYIDLVRILQHIENNIESVKISSLKFEYEDRKMKNKEVDLLFSLKQIEK